MDSIPKKQIFQNTLALSFSRVIALLVGATNLMLIVSSLGINEYGQYATIFSLLGIFAIISDFGLDQLYLGYPFSTTDRLEQRNLRDFFSARLIVLGIYLLVIILASSLLPYGRTLRLGFLLASLVNILTYLGTTLMTFLQRKLLLVGNAIADAMGRIFALGMLVSLFYFFSPSLATAIFSQISGSFITLCLVIYLVWRKGISLQYFYPRRIRISKLLRLAFPLATVSALNQFFFRIDIPLLAYFRSGLETGLYAFAYKLFEFSAYPGAFVIASFYPLLTQAKNPQKQRILIQTAWKYLLSLSVIISLIVIVSFPMVTSAIELFSKYRDSQTYLVILSLALPLLYLQTLYSSLFVIKRKQTMLVVFYLLAALTNVILNLIFIPQFGAYSSAVITLITQSMATLPLIFYFHR